MTMRCSHTHHTTARHSISNTQKTKTNIGAGVNPLVKTLRGFEQDARRRVKTTPGLRAKGATRDVYVVGDNAAVEGAYVCFPCV